jgi:biotin carboxyl carrier protein
VALIDAAAARGGGALVLSPAVGLLRGVPAPGRILEAGAPFARLTIVRRSHPLLLPDGVAGSISEIAVEGSGADVIPVEYGQPILSLAPLDAALPGERTAASVTGASPARASLAAGQSAVVSPADGVFYRRPRPGEPAYVEVGSKVKSGQTLALIEAMKSFSAIAYGGGSLPDEAEVVEIRAEDASEVRHGQILFVVK